jgi:hypothetical protein
MCKTYLIFLSIFFNVVFGVCQNETAKWHFGSTGLNFLNSPPTLAPSSMTTGEGCASISDGLGNTLFYTDGMSIFNQQGMVMANGNGLLANGDATQAALIVKQPGNTNIYFVFTLSSMATGSLCYSVVDLTLAAGLGSVTTKNTFLFTTSTEKLTGVKHCNGTDTWIISHESTGNIFRSYLLTATGVNPSPVLSAVGPIYSNSTAYGAMKASPNGKKLAVCVTAPYHRFELYDFNPANGIVSNQLPLANVLLPYGCEFSPDGTKLYGTSNYFSTNVLYQWDLCVSSNSAVIASQYTMNTTPGVKLGTLQMALNGKIYVARALEQTLGVINNPNVGGIGCNFVDLGQNIAPGNCYFGLPNFVSSYFSALTPTSPINYSINPCQNVSFFTSSCLASGNAPVSVLWNFDDPASGNANNSVFFNPTHFFVTPGAHTVQLIAYYQCRTDTLRQVIQIIDAGTTFSVNGRLNICKNQSTTLTAVPASNQSVLSYTWVPGTNTNSATVFSPTATSVYTVSVKNVNGCSATKTVQVNVSSCTALSEQMSDIADVNIYPNPNDGRFYIETNILATYKIYDQLGILVQFGKVSSQKQYIDLSAFASGVYFVQFIEENNVRIVKLVKTD